MLLLLLWVQMLMLQVLLLHGSHRGVRQSRGGVVIPHAAAPTPTRIGLGPKLMLLWRLLHRQLLGG